MFCTREHCQVLLYETLCILEIFICQPLFSFLFRYCPVLLPYPEFRVAALQEKSVWAIPVAVDDVCLSIAIEVSQCYSSAMLIPVLHTFA